MVWSAEITDQPDNNSNDPQRNQKRPGAPPSATAPVGIPPPGYECKRCGKPGHYIKYCPTNGDPSYDRDAKNNNQAGGETTAATTVAKVIFLLSLSFV